MRCSVNLTPVVSRLRGASLAQAKLTIVGPTGRHKKSGGKAEERGGGEEDTRMGYDETGRGPGLGLRHGAAGVARGAWAELPFT